MRYRLSFVPETGVIQYDGRRGYPKHRKSTIEAVVRLANRKGLIVMDVVKNIRNQPMIVFG